MQDIKQDGKSSLLGACTGSIAGLAAVTPAAGFVGPVGALCIGAISSVVCRFFSFTIKVRTFSITKPPNLFYYGRVGLGFPGCCPARRLAP
jgi:ammonia channel protein AmtB